MTIISNSVSRHMDRMAVLLSGVCLAHCLLLPLLLMVFPMLAIGIGGEDHFHSLLLWVVIPISVLGLGLGFRQHRRGGLLGFGFAAMALLAFASTWGHDNLPLPGEVSLMVAASVALALAHVLNLRSVRSCRSPPARG